MILLIPVSALIHLAILKLTLLVLNRVSKIVLLCATALFEVQVVGADTKETAKILAKSIVCSNLTKTAIAGHDANWGRILCAMGYSGAQFDPEKVDLFFESQAGRIQIIEDGTAVDYSEEKATEILSQPEVKAIADIKMGNESATAWGCDLTYDYIKINADYRS